MTTKRKVEEWTIEKLVEEQTQISFPDFQREKRLWSRSQKALLIDSILKDLDIPKLYFNQNDKGDFEVIDGQQRLWAIWDFFNDEYSCRVNEKELKASQLNDPEHESIKNTIKNYRLQITVFEEADDEYLRQLFLRLQLGLLLNTGEKLHASSGQMRNLVFDQLAKHNFIQELGLPKGERRRFSRETLCAQVCINSFTRANTPERFERTRYDDLLHFFNWYADPQGKDRTFFQQQRKRIVTVLDHLWQAFGDDTKELRNRSYILSVYLLFEELVDKDGNVSGAKKKEFAQFVLTLWNELKEDARKGVNTHDEELYKFQTYLSSAPTERYQIERRHEKLSEFYANFKKTGKIKGG